MPKIKMLSSYRHFYNGGETVEEDEKKARELVDSGRAEYVSTEEAAPVVKEVKTSKKVGFTCDSCGKSFSSARGLKTHAKSH